jgi:hypothetical protein
MLKIGNTWHDGKETFNYNKMITKKKIQFNSVSNRWPLLGFQTFMTSGIKTVIGRRPQRVWRLAGFTRRHVSHPLHADLFIPPLTSPPLFELPRPASWRKSRDAHIMQSLTTATCNKLPSMRANQVSFLYYTRSEMVTHTSCNIPFLSLAIKLVLTSRVCSFLFNKVKPPESQVHFTTSISSEMFLSQPSPVTFTNYI